MKLKITYLLADFDGVLSLYLGQLHEESPLYQIQLNKIKEKNRAEFQLFAKTICDVIEKYIHSSTINADLVILAVGSARQTRQHDHYASQCNHNNGLCFTLFADLAEKRGWLFNRLLMPDCLNRPYTFEQLGKTMGPLEKNADGIHVFKEDTFSDNLFWTDNASLLREGKKELLALHLAYLHQHYPGSKYDVTLEFWDDEFLHIRTCREYAQQYTHTLPAPVVTRHFNWRDIIKKFDGNKERFELALKENIHTERQEPSKQTSHLGLLSFWTRQATKKETKLDIPYSWIALGISAFALACLLMKAHDSKASDFKPKSMY